MPMPHPTLRTLVAACTFAGVAASAAACRDTPTAIDQNILSLPRLPDPAAPTYPQPGTIGATARELPVGGRVLLPSALYPLLSHDDEVYEGIAWSSSDPLVAATSPATGPLVPEWMESIWVLGLVPGSAVLTAEGGGLRAMILITVLDTSAAPTTVVVDDFFVIEYEEGGRWRYAPQIVIRDTALSPQSAAIAVRFELPNAGSSPPCAMRREVSGTPTNLLFGQGIAPELSLEGPPGYRIPAGGMAVAHLTLRVPGPFAKVLTLQGRVVSGTPPTALRPGRETDPLSCG
jgi:hypothetical protein